MRYLNKRDLIQTRTSIKGLIILTEKHNAETKWSHYLVSTELQTTCLSVDSTKKTVAMVSILSLFLG